MNTQGPTTNKLIITWKDYTPSVYTTERQSFRCNSLEKAEKILSKRNDRRIFFASFFDNMGVKTVIEYNTKDSILSI